MENRVTRLWGSLTVVFALGAILTGAAPAPVGAASSPAQVVIADAERHLGAPYRWGATGPTHFDCSGLVYAVFRETGHFSVIGNGAYRDAAQMWRYFRARGLASPRDGQPGDLVVFGGGAHIGIYLGGGKVISALTSGVAIHGINAISTPFTTFLHTGLARPASVSGPASGSGPASASGPAGLVGVATATVNLRTRPTTSAPVATTVAMGSTWTTLRLSSDSQGRTWQQVRLRSGRTGWVAGWYTRLSGPARSSVALALRTGPGTGYGAIRTVAAGSRFSVLTASADSRGRLWSRVRLTSGAVGWLAAWYTTP